MYPQPPIVEPQVRDSHEERRYKANARSDLQSTAAEFGWGMGAQYEFVVGVAEERN